MRKIFSLALVLCILLGASTAHATETTPSDKDLPQPTIITCPIQLFYRNPESGQLEEVNFIEPDFETPPENYLYEITNRYTYEVRFQVPTANSAGIFDIDYSTTIANCDLGTINIDYIIPATSYDIPATIYHGELKFVATGNLTLSHSAPAFDDSGLLSFNLSTTNENMLKAAPITPANVSIYIAKANTSQNLYTTDLTSYLYPEHPVAFRPSCWRLLTRQPFQLNLHQR